MVHCTHWLDTEKNMYCRNPTLAKCGGEAQHLKKVRIWSPPGLPNVKRTYRKWPRIGHLNICSPSYGQKKGRESNWQFDSRPLKVGNRPLSDLWIESAIRRWKDLDEGYKFGSDLVAIRLRSRELWAPKVLGQFRDNFGTISGLQPGSPEKKWHLGVGAAESHRVYYRE